MGKKIQKGDEGEELQKQFNKEIDITKENMETFLLQNEKSKLFTYFINILGRQDKEISKEKNPEQYQFFIDVLNAMHTLEDVQSIHKFIDQIQEKKNLILRNTKE